jgi:hypothetical protein
MAIRAFLAAVALTTAFEGVAGAQPPAEEGDEQPQEGYEAPPQQGYPPPQQSAPPPGSAAPPEGAPPPIAPDATGLGAVGQLVFSDDLLVQVARSSQNGQSQSAILLQPAIDVFVSPNLSIGGQVRIGVASTDSGAVMPLGVISNGPGDTTTIGLLPRIGFNIPIGPTASIWPRASVAYVHNSFTSNGGGYSTSSYTVSFIGFVPVLFQPVSHFFIGGGPYLSTDLISKFESGGTSVDSAKTTEFGLLSTVGGYFGGT